ncbi:RiPP maturation radical SAM C-methyltransferase [Thermodesulfobacteriota bacterium]
MDCCLVSMPHAPVERPSLALGTLQSILRNNGISTVTRYANIQWCERIGLPRYGFAERAWKMFGDWTFARAAFPEFKPDSLEYFSELFKKHTCRSLGINPAKLPTALEDWLGNADDFIDELAHQIVDQAPRVVGCSSTFIAHVASLAILRRIRDLDPGIVTMLGGANCESEMGLTTHEKFPWVDFVVSGEADDIIVDLVNGILEEGRDLGLERIPEGVFAPIHRASGYSGLSETPARAVSTSFRDNPLPNYDDYFSTLKAAPVLSEIVQPGLPIEGSRGCWWGERKQCTYCSHNGAWKEYRSKTSAQILDELDALNDRYGIDWFGFSDNIVNMKWFRELFPELGKRDQRYRFACEVTPIVGKRHLGLMSEAGVKHLQPGIENLDTEVLSLLNKAQKSWHNVRFLKWCSYYGIQLNWWILEKAPALDDGWYARTARLCPSLCHLQPPRRLHRILFVRFSAYHRQAETYKFELEAHDSYSMIYPLPKEDLNCLAYFLQDGSSTGKPSDRHGEAESATGRQALVDEIVLWNTMFSSTARPVLETHDTGSKVHFHDTRPCAENESFTLSGEERDVYLACEDGIREERLFRLCGERGIPFAGLDRIVESLLHSKVLLSLDKHFLSLGIPQPSAELPRTPVFACGSANRSLYAAINRLRERPFPWLQHTGTT